MRRWVLVGVAALAITGTGVAAGTVLLDDDEPAGDTSTFTPTPLASFDTSALTVPRASFCDGVDPRQVEAALGDEPVDARSYENGEEVTLADGVNGPITDVAHEYGCTWVRADQSEARAWVFAPPVDARRAAALVKAADTGKEQGCEASPEPAYGSPSVELVCTSEAGGVASYRGLFGDAWLTCELSLTDVEVSEAELLRRTGAWCVGVAMGASAS
jgi:hypothetical protein